MTDFLTLNLSELDLDDIFGAETNRPPSWHKFRLIFSKLAADLNLHMSTDIVEIDMADAAHALVVGPNAGAGQTRMSSFVLVVDPDSSGASEILTLDETALPPGVYSIKNSGGEGIAVQDSAASAIATVATATTALFHLNEDTGVTLVGTMDA